MNIKYHIELGIISFLLGLTILLQRLFFPSIWIEIIYYLIIIVLLIVVQRIFERKYLDITIATKISFTSWFIGFLIGYGIYYLEF